MPRDELPSGLFLFYERDADPVGLCRILTNTKTGHQSKYKNK